jgi:hypothetical protein
MFPTPRFTTSWFGRRAGRGLVSRPPRRRSRRASRVEALEDRTLLSSPDYLIAACVGPDADTSHADPVLLYSASGNNAPTPLPAIPPQPATSLHTPTFPAFNPATGELFIANNFGSDGHDVARFWVDGAGDYTPNGTVTGNGLTNYVSGIAFHDGELFANTYWSGTISRFKFDAQGKPIPNGTIGVGSIYLVGAAFSPSGELFANTYTTIYRYLIDPTTGAAIPHGTIADPGSGGLHGIAFSPDGDLFAAELSDNRVLRFSFDTHGNAVLDQSIAVHGAIGVAVSPSGELLVTEATDEGGSITGFLPDASGNYAFNWSIPSDAMSDPLYGVAIFPTATTHLLVTAQPPASVIAGSTFSLTVTAKDSSGNVDSSFKGDVTVALAADPGGATVGGTLTVSAINGVATFSDLTLDKVGTGYTLKLSGSGALSTTSDAITVTAAAATQLAVTTQPPAGVTAGTGFGLAVSAEDRFGNVNPGFTGDVTVRIENNPGGATLGGTLSATAKSGVATFTDLTLDRIGVGYTLQLSASGLADTTTSSFNVQTSLAVASMAVGWASQTAPLQTAADGLRLLPAGRNTDLPWLGIEHVHMNLSQAVPLAASDVQVKSARGINYGQVTLSGSGTSYILTLTQPINQADRVTIQIGNALIATFTRRLDVLPGDFNDDGVVDSRDIVGVRNEMLGFAGAVPTIYGDINGDGKVDINDYNAVRKLLFTRLPPIA